MTPRSRVWIAGAVTAVLIAGMFTLMFLRVERWSAIGYAGVNYIQDFGSKKIQVFGLSSGQIMMVLGGGPADLAGLRRGDQVLDIDGVPVKDIARLRAIDARVKRGDTVIYRVRRDNKVLRIPVRIDSPFRNPFLLLTMFVNAFVALAFVSIGLLVFARQPDDRRARVFYAMATFAALSVLATTSIAADLTQVRGIVTDPSSSLPSLLALPVLFFAFVPLILHLTLIFPHERPILRERPSVIRWIYTVPAAAAILLTTMFLFATLAQKPHAGYVEITDDALRIAATIMTIAGVAILLRLMILGRREGEREAVLARPVQTIVATLGILVAISFALAATGFNFASVVVALIAVFAPSIPVFAYLVFACVALVRSYREAGLEERRQVKWPIWGTFTALAVKLVFTLSMYGGMLAVMFTGHDFGRFVHYSQIAQLVPTIVYLLIPISFAAAILKYRLMNIDVIIKKTVAYTILSGLIIVIYLVLVGGLGTVLVSAVGVRNQTMVIASTLVVALLFVPLRNKLQYLVDRNLFRQKYDYPAAMNAIGAQTLTATDIRAFLLFAAETLQQALQNRSVVIFERRDDDLLATAKVGVPDSILGSLRVPVADATTAALQRIDAALVVPVRTHGTLHAVIALGAKLNDRDFDAEDTEFLSSAADQIGVTIERIRLQREESDFEQARQIQQSLLPATVPNIEGVDVSGTWKPARAVGGDYYDLLELSPTQLAVCIGDVAGKGMPAALLMSGLQAAVRASASPDVEPAQLCERVRRVIVQSLAGGRFVTFFFCTIDTAARKIRYCNAGHNPPVLVRADGTSIRLDKGGPALSRLFSGTPFTGGEAALMDGDRLVLFTDGVSEARNEAGTDYGEERLEQLIAANRRSRARDLIAAIADSVSAWSGGRVDDDLTLVAVAVG